MTAAADVAALVALLGSAAVYGTDVFCALVQRPALARVDDTALTAVMGNLHRVADRRMVVPGVLGLALSAVAAALAGTAGAPTASTASTAAGVALLAQVAWLLVYLRISAPINRRLTAAAVAGTTPPDARAMQQAWDRVIVPRAALQGLAVLALGVCLLA